MRIVPPQSIRSTYHTASIKRTDDRDQESEETEIDPSKTFVGYLDPTTRAYSSCIKRPF